MGERTDEGMQEQGKTLKRRGILAAAGAVVAGLVAKQLAEESPVSADGSTWTFPYMGTVNVPDTAFTVINQNGSGIYVQSTNGEGVIVQSNSSYGVQGNTKAPTGSGYAGVLGVGNGDGTIGVAGGGSGSGIGVQGQNNSPSGVGVLGASIAGIGVQGQSRDAGGVGVLGVSATGFPIIGKVFGTGSDTNTAAGVLGAGTKGAGVQGQSITGHGVVGTTNATDGHAGLSGSANNTGGVGLMGIAPNYGQQTVGHAGEFYGNVKIYGGSLLAPSMQAVVPHAGDGTYRALHTVTSPEGWAEDFGKGTLAGGKADITLDPDFAALVDTSTLHVFLTPHVPQHLHVPEQTATGFMVVATPSGATSAGGPKRPDGVGTFSYRVVAKRKDLRHERLAKVAAPTTPKAPTHFTLPETPAVTPGAPRQTTAPGAP